MTYELEFNAEALREWKKLDKSVKEPLKKKLEARLEEPHVPKSQLRGMPDCYKIKNGPYRLIYRVFDDVVMVMVMAVGKRERLAAYAAAKSRIDDEPSCPSQ